MRKIKFRVWNTDSNEWVSNENKQSETKLNYSSNYLVKWHPYILEQYTGLKDKNDVEIYEGDLLWANNQHRSYEYTVIFYEGSFIYRKGKRSQKKYLNSKSIYLQNLEVIGNIHENKDLI